MYTIYVHNNGSCDCVCRLQDGTERFSCPNLDEAVRKVKQFAKVMNGMKIKKKDIAFLRPVPVEKIEWEEFRP